MTGTSVPVTAAARTLSRTEPRALGRVFPIVGRDPQQPADVAVVMTTILRHRIATALGSVFAQSEAGTIQVLIGVDLAAAGGVSLDDLYAFLATRPSHVGALVLDTGYSTAERNGGLHRSSIGGVLLTALSYLANAPYVAYLDDDNAWGPAHLAALRRAVAGRAWAYSWRWLVDEETGRTICLDLWDSVGAGRGRFAEVLGGFADPNTILIDKRRAEAVLPLWAVPLGENPLLADRQVVRALLREHQGAPSERATCFYGIRRTHRLWPSILAYLKARREGAPLPPLPGTDDLVPLDTVPPPRAPAQVRLPGALPAP